MTDLGAALARAALGFADTTLRTLEQQALSDAAKLAAALGVGPVVAGMGSADAELAAARGELVAFRAVLGGPLSLGVCDQAARHLGAALGHVSAAIAAIAPGKGLPELLGGPLAAINPKGLAQQLGLSQGGAPAIDAKGVSWTLRAPGAVQVGVGPAGIKIDSVQLNATLALVAGGPALALALELDGARIAIGGPGFDGFLQQLLGSGGGATADLRLGVDSARGLTLAGATHGPIILPAHAEAGLLDVGGVRLDLGTGGPGAFELGALVKATLGPIGFAVDGVGVRLVIDADAVGGGNLPVKVSAKPPTGVGATLDLSLVTGGGYLSFDEARGRYGGVLALRAGPIDVSAFGVLDTKVPGGFSLIVVLAAQFTPAIELSFGFTLNGVGGIVGIQRTIDTDALRARLHDHALDHLLFPEDPVASAPQILELVGAVFPPEPGGIVVGPLVKLGWGEPVSFVTLTLGVVIALPDTKVVLLGRLHLAVPAPEAPIVDLNAEVYGEVTADHVLVLVIIEDSHIGGFAVSGDLGMFVSYGSSPDFAISAGGFHPRYTPPPLLTSMNRLTIDLSPPGPLTITANAYVALTASSFQLGAKLELAGSVGPVDVHGWLQLDAIVRWAPSFSFEVDLDAGFEMRWEGVSFAGIRLTLHLSGPAPWIAEGTATIDIAFLPDVHVHVGPLTWGPSSGPPPPLAHPLDLVRDALSEPAAWRARLPGGTLPVSVLSTPSDPPTLVHPIGEFEVRQRAVPLEITLARVGASPVPGEENRLHLAQPTISDSAGSAIDAGTVSPLEESFAMGQFLDLSDDEKLRHPSFEPKTAGIHIGPADGVLTPVARALQSELHYDTVFPHQDLDHRRDEFLDLDATAVASIVGVGAAGRSVLRADVRYATTPRPIVVADAGAVTIRAVHDLGVPAGVPAGRMTYSDAAEAVAAAAGPVQVVALGGAG